MAFDQDTRNRLAKFVSEARELLTEEFTRQLQNVYGINPEIAEITPIERLTALNDAQRETARVLRNTITYYLADKESNKKNQLETIDRIIREQAFTILNRLCALRMAESRGILIESIAFAYQSKGFQLYSRLAGTGLGETGDAYTSYLFSLFDEFAVDLAVLFDRFSPQGRLFPRQTALSQLLKLINDPEIDQLWVEDETIGWMYQYFNSKEERQEMRAASQSPRNSRELAVRNQFFTPRYVVEFLTDNTLGRIWYEMVEGKTSLIETCHYMFRRPNEIFLRAGEKSPGKKFTNGNISQEDLLKQPVYIIRRAIKDPREIKLLDPACGSMHFGLYAFDLFEQIYSEAWDLEEALGENALQRLPERESLHRSYLNRDTFLRDVPRLIIEGNIHGIDIDPRAVQIAGLSLWLRAQKSWQILGIKPQERPQIRRSNIVCAEPMPGSRVLLEEFLQSLKEDRLEKIMRQALNIPIGQKVHATKTMADSLAKLVRTVWQEMELAGDAGSLLRVEEKLRDTIAKAKYESQDKAPLFRVLEFGHNELSPYTITSNEKGDQQDFWKWAEDIVLESFRQYVDLVAIDNIFEKRLFVEDAKQGFAFIDLCYKSYDVAVMNPPFGEIVPTTVNIVDATSTKSKDISALFLSRALSLLDKNGLSGVIGPRSLFFLQSNADCRLDVLLTESRLRLVADLGLRVMDSAWIEAIAFIFGNNAHGVARFYRLLDSVEKETDLLKAINSEHSPISRDVPVNTFMNYPFKSISYWLPDAFLSFFGKQETIETVYGTIRQGLATSNDFRYLRLWAECPPNSMYLDYYPFGKGGEYSPFYGIPEVMVFWQDAGRIFWCDISENTGLPKSNIWMLGETINSYFQRPGLTYTQRTNSAFSPRILPENSLFATKGETIFCTNKDDLLFVLGISQSRPFQALVEAFVSNADSTQSEGAARSYLSGLIKRLPLPDTNTDIKKIVSDITAQIVEIKRMTFFEDETTQLFFHPFVFCSNFSEKSLSEINRERQLNLLNQDAVVLDLSYKLNQEGEKIYSLLDNDIQFLDATLGKHPQAYEDGQISPEILNIYLKSDDEMLKWMREQSITGRIFVNQCFHSSRKVEIISHLSHCKGTSTIEQLKNGYLESKNEKKQLASRIISYLFGVVAGRWNIKSLLENSFEISPNLFEKLPEVPPGFGQTEVFQHAGNSIFEYGVSVEDAENPNDLVFNVLKTLKYLWPYQSDSMEQDLCDILGVNNIRKYINNPGMFFLDHLRRYSKSRRQSPIYWPLSTPTNSYTIWLYYHRLNDQTLFTCVNDYVDPKLTQTSNEVSRLRQKRGRNATDEKNMEYLLDLENELKDFRAELLRVAKFWKPNLHDGVQITAAPLWRLFQYKPWQKKLKDLWGSLENGDYDWAHIAYSIWPDRVLEKCKADKSLAISHGLEYLYVEPKDGVKKKKSKKILEDLDESELDF